MFNKNRCYNGGNQHKFQPRYTEKERQLIGVKTLWVDNLESYMTLNEYVYDVCVWCGKIVKN